MAEAVMVPHSVYKAANNADSRGDIDGLELKPEQTAAVLEGRARSDKPSLMKRVLSYFKR